MAISSLRGYKRRTPCGSSIQLLAGLMSVKLKLLYLLLLRSIFVEHTKEMDIEGEKARIKTEESVSNTDLLFQAFPPWSLPFPKVSCCNWI